MTQLLQPGHHPDADQLSAFADHALPPHEQQHLLAHLATCPDCRHLVYLAQQANPIEFEAPQPQPVATRRLFFNWKFAWPSAIACAVFLALYLHGYIPILNRRPTNDTFIVDHVKQTSPAPANPPAQNLTANIAPYQPPPPPPLPSASSAQPSRPSRSSFSKATPKSNAEAKTAQIATVDQLALAPPPPAPTMAFAGTGAGLSLARASASDAALHGTITDPTGAAISRAKITATNTLTGVTLSRETSSTGDFFLPLPSGTYNVEAAAPGFQRLLTEDVKVAPPTQLALNLKLPIGSASQTVTVTNAPPSLDTANTTLSGTIENQLYSNLPLQARTGSGGSAPPAARQSQNSNLAQTLPPPPPPSPPTAAAPGMQQGVYGGTGQTNLNQNYVEGIPVSDVASATAATNASKPATPAVARAAAVAAAPALIAKKQPTLPSHLPALSTIANAHHTLAIDTAGALFRSEDAGVTWTPVTIQWKGRATHLTLTPPLTISTLAQSKAAADQRSTPTTFQLTTDTGALYTSPDGQTWHLK